MADVKMPRVFCELNNLGMPMVYLSEESVARYLKDFPERTGKFVELTVRTSLTDAAPALLEALEAYDLWEANLICEDHANEADGKRVVSAAMWQELLDLQTKRNAAIAQARGEVVL